MRVCPKCRYIDPAEWRHSKYSYWIDWTEYENWLAMGHTTLPKGGKTEDGLYVYRRTKKRGHVERKAKIDYGNQWNIPMERRDFHDIRAYWKIETNQTKLFEAIEKGGF